MRGFGCRLRNGSTARTPGSPKCPRWSTCRTLLSRCCRCSRRASTPSSCSGARPAASALAARSAAPAHGARRLAIRNRALLAVLFRSGLRISEALALYPKDLDPAGGSVRVLHGKGNKARTAPLPSDAAEAVDRWPHCRKRVRLTSLFDCRNGCKSAIVIRGRRGLTRCRHFRERSPLRSCSFWEPTARSRERPAQSGSANAASSSRQTRGAIGTRAPTWSSAEVAAHPAGSAVSGDRPA
jgi:hypothetical protein